VIRDELLVYYERELEFIRSMAVEFAEKYPGVAGALQLPSTAGPTPDPHVERLIEAFAMLTARIQLRLDDEFSEVTDALLGILYPHYVAPVPSLAIVELAPDPDATYPPQGLYVEPRALLYSRRPVKGGVRCRFRTSYPVTLWPVEIAAAEIRSASELRAALPSGARSLLRLRLETRGGHRFGDLEIDRLRLYLGAQAGVGHRLYELFCRAPLGLALEARSGGASSSGPVKLLDASSIRPIGFAADEGMLEYPPESFVGYRLLQEYFRLPEKFLFVELRDLDLASVGPDAESIELSLLLSEDRSELDLRVQASDFRLGCTPAVNIFEMQADPIRITHTAIEYPVVPDVRHPRAYEIYAIRSASSVERETGNVTEFEPIYTARHGSRFRGHAYWYAARRSSLRKEDAGTDLYLSLVDEKFNPLQPPSEVLHVTALCTNRDLPSALNFGHPAGDFEIQGHPGVSRVTCLGSPTKPLRAPIGAGSRWRLISHLALNHLSLTGRIVPDASRGKGPEEHAGLDALREILKLYDFEDSPATRQRIAGLIGLRTRRVVRRLPMEGEPTFARGHEIELLFDPNRFAGTGVFLFASVLEAFLGLYASLNSFTQTVACTRIRESVLKRWPPRAGEQQLL